MGTYEEKIARKVRETKLEKQNLMESVDDTKQEDTDLLSSTEKVTETKETFFGSLIADLLKESILSDASSDELNEAIEQVKVKGVKLYSYAKKELIEDLTVSDLESYKDVLKGELFKSTEPFVEQMITNKSSEEHSKLKKEFIIASKKLLSETNEEGESLIESIDDELSESINAKAISYLTLNKLVENLSDFIVNKKVILDSARDVLR